MYHNNKYFPATDEGGHKVFTQITVPPAPAPVVAIERVEAGHYISHTPLRTRRHPDFKSALEAIYR